MTNLPDSMSVNAFSVYFQCPNGSNIESDNGIIFTCYLPCLISNDETF